MSGSAFNKTWGLIPRKNQAEKLARFCGWKGQPGNEREILSYLEGVSAFEFEDVMYQMMTDEEQFGFGNLIPFGPVIEPYDSDNCLIFKDPVEMAREVWTNEIDVIVTGTSFEGILRAGASEEKAAQVLQNPSYFAPLLALGLSPSDPKAVELGNKIKKLFYEQGQEPSVDNQLSFLNFSSFLHFWHVIQRLILSRNAHGSGKTYLLRFDVDGELNLFKKQVKKCEKISGACHADDIFHLFTTIYHPPPLPSSPEFLVIEKFVGILTSFAITGNPNCDEITNLTIKPCQKSKPVMCVNLTLNDVAEIELPENDKLKVWNSIYEEANVPLI